MRTCLPPCYVQLYGSLLSDGCKELRYAGRMQDRYVGDFGDFIKLALLRALQPRHRLGIAWWLYPNETHNGDGRHIAYLEQAGKWRGLDRDLFDGLAEIVKSGDRRVSALQAAGFLPGAVFCDEPIPVNGPTAQRRLNREAWLGRMKDKFTGCDLIFLDPDNGLETTGFSLGAVVAGKSVGLAQLDELRSQDRTLVIYHHQTRRKGGHLAELDYWAERLRGRGFGTVSAIRSQPCSARAFFLLDAPHDVLSRAYQFTEQWNAWVSWHPDALVAK